MPEAKRDMNRLGLRERKKLQTRQDLLAIAQKLFAENDFADVTVEQIADLARISPKTFFNYFQNKSHFLAEYLHDWLMTIGFWSFEDTPIADCRSALIPTDAHAQRESIIKHRRIFKMAMQQTDFFDHIYRLDERSSEFDAELHEAIRRPRTERVKQAQAKGIVRNDISATDVCRLYDALRFDAVQRWLYLSDENAKPELLHEWFEISVDALIKGIESRG